MDGLLFCRTNPLLLPAKRLQVGAYTIESFGGAYHKHLLTRGNSTLEIIPERGALMNYLILDGHLLTDHYKDAAELNTLDWAKSALLFPFPNRLREGQYSWNGNTYQFPINLAPNAIHGFGMFESFEVSEVEQAAEASTIHLSYHYDRKFDYYPFRFSITLSYTLSDDVLRVSFMAKNEDQQAIPMGLGWHPYFTLGGNVADWFLQTPDLQKVVVDHNMIPTGVRVPFTHFAAGESIGGFEVDTCFQTSEASATVIELSSDAGRLQYWQDDNFKYVQLFIPPNRTCLAIEPMTCNVDAFNQAPSEITLEPNQTVGGSFGIKWTKA